MKKVVKIIGIIIGIIVVLGIVFFTIDYNRVKNNELPLFCIQIDEANDGGTRIYLGLGYKVIDFNTISGYDDIKIGTWFMDYEDFNEKIKIYDEEYNKTQYLENKNINSIEISENGLSSVSPARNYMLNKDEMYILANLINNLTFSDPNETCDGISNYIIKYNNEDITYGIEVYDDVIHIVKAGGGEAVLSNEQSEMVKNIINKV